MDNRLIHIGEQGEGFIQTQTESSVKNIPANEFRDDDLTVVVLVNTDVTPNMPSDGYYDEPDMQELQRRQAEEYRKANEEYLHKTNEEYIRRGLIKTTSATPHTAPVPPAIPPKETGGIDVYAVAKDEQEKIGTVDVSKINLESAAKIAESQSEEAAKGTTVQKRSVLSMVLDYWR
jgi:hypothetical protein